MTNKLYWWLNRQIPWRLYARAFKLSLLAVRVIWISSWGQRIPNTATIHDYINRIWPAPWGDPERISLFKLLPKGYFIISAAKYLLPRPFHVKRHFYHEFFNKDFILCKGITITYTSYRSLATALNGFIICAWVCDKMGIDLKIRYPTRTVWRHFENDTLIHLKKTKQGHPSCSFLNKNYQKITEHLGSLFVPSEYASKVFSKLSLKADIKADAQRWVDEHIKEDWIAVHYRGTDIKAARSRWAKNRYRIDLDEYIIYLKSVLDPRLTIFACSDQAQFIDKMCAAFPGKVHARDIKRSYDRWPIHLRDGSLNDKNLDNFEQERNALIDILILAKAKLIYTTGSGFIDTVRYFNPQTRIVSLDRRKIGRGKNNAPIPRKDLLKKLSISL